MTKAFRFTAAAIVFYLVGAAIQAGIFSVEKPSPVPIRADGAPMPTCGPGDPFPCLLSPRR